MPNPRHCLTVLLHQVKDALTQPLCLVEAGGTAAIAYPPMADDQLQATAQAARAGTLDPERCTWDALVLADGTRAIAVLSAPCATVPLAFVRTVNELLKSGTDQGETDYTAQVRTLLTNQLITLDHAFDENDNIFSLAGAERYSPNVPRCAILCCMGVLHSESLHMDYDKADKYFSEAILASAQHTDEDIYGLLNVNQFLIFKEDLSGAATSRTSACILAFLKDLTDYMAVHFNLTLSISVGSFYTKLSQLRESYRECAFLAAHYDYLHDWQEPWIYIDQYLYEYLLSSIPLKRQNKCFGDYAQIMGANPRFPETIIALSHNHSNLAAAARQLGLHKNTVLQRFGGIRSALRVDPLYSDRDRVALRSYALCLNHTVTWHADIVIQPGSALHLGMQRLAELVHRYTGGTLQINVHTTSTSGDNNQLYKYITTGAFDLTSCNCGVLDSVTGGLSAMLETPFLFDTEDQASALLNGAVLQAIEPYLSGAQVLCPAIWSMGWRYLTSSDVPIRLPQQMQGQRMRIMFTEVLASYFRLLQAEPIKTYYNNTYAGLSSGALTCQENPCQNTLQMRFYEHQRYITELNFHYSVEPLLISRKSYDKLTPVQKEALLTACRETTLWLHEEQKRLNAQALEQLVQRHGMISIKPSPEEEAMWRAIAQPLYENSANPDFLAAILDAKRRYDENL